MTPDAAAGLAAGSGSNAARGAGAPGTVAAAASFGLTYRPDLDGLRAVAVALVILDHADWPIGVASGFSGVTAFFVLSGYLITSLLVAEQRSTGRIDLPAFYLRRALRLLPALGCVIAFVVVAGMAGVYEHWAEGVLATLAYVGNWAQGAGISTGPMAHTWSLAVEEHFYVLWPLALIVLSRRALAVAIVALIAGGFLWRFAAPYPWSFYATPPHVPALLVGCAAALWGRPLPVWTGAPAIAVLVSTAVIAVPLSGEAAIAAATVIVLSRPNTLVPLAAIGRRAYGLYLWDLPLAILLGPASVPVTIVAAELSYRLVERPALRLKGELRGPASFSPAAAER